MKQIKIKKMKGGQDEEDSGVKVYMSLTLDDLWMEIDFEQTKARARTVIELKQNICVYRKPKKVLFEEERKDGKVKKSRKDYSYCDSSILFVGIYYCVGLN